MMQKSRCHFGFKETRRWRGWWPVWTQVHKRAGSCLSWEFALLAVVTWQIMLLPVSCFPVAHKTTEQANIIADTAVSGANEVAQSAVEGVENAAVASGLVSLVSDGTAIYLKSSTFCSCSLW